MFLRLTKLSTLLFALLAFNAAIATATSFPRTPHNRLLSASGTLNTNAKRLAAGFPPLPPKRGTRTQTSRRSVVSPSNYDGVVIVKNSGGSAIGYIATVPNSAGGYTIGNILKAISVTFVAQSFGLTSGIEMKDATNDYNSTPYVGGSVTPTQNLLSTNTNFVLLNAVASTSSQSGPQASMYQTSTSLGDIESPIWTYDASTNAFGFQWVNYDGTSPTISILYDPGTGIAAKTGRLILTANPTEYISSHPNAQQVTLSLIGY